LLERLRQEGLFDMETTNRDVDEKAAQFEILEEHDPLRRLFAEAGRTPWLTDRETADRVRLVQQANQDGSGPLEPAVATALNELLRSNILFVVSVAKEYSNVSDLDRSELIQEGVLGLIEGIRRFEPTRGVKLSSYAFWWIRQRITRAMNDTGRTIRVPSYLVQEISKVRKARRRLEKEAGNDATAHRIARELGMDTDHVLFLLTLGTPMVSLDAPIATAGDVTIGDAMADPSESIPSLVCKAEIRERLQSVLDVFHPKERHVIVRRFGLDGEEPGTLQEIADELKLTRERIRQIEAKVLAALSRNPVIRLLNDEGN